MMGIDVLDPALLCSRALAAATFTKEATTIEVSEAMDLVPLVSGVDGHGKPVIVVQVTGDAGEVARVVRLLAGCGLYAAVTVVTDATLRDESGAPITEALLAYATTRDGMTEARAAYTVDDQHLAWGEVSECPTAGPLHDALAQAWDGDDGWDSEIMEFMATHPAVDVNDVRVLIGALLARRGHNVIEVG